MGANASAMSDEKLVDLPLPGEDEAMLDLPAPPMENGDDPLLQLDVGKMKRRPCSVDPRLAANPKRRAPPINPKTCKEGSVAMGKDGEFYVIKSGRWIKASKRLDERKKEQIRERLNEKMELTQKVKAKVQAKRAQTPKRAPAKRGPGRPKGSKNKRSSKKGTKTPMRKRCPKGSRKNKKSGKCVKK